MGRHPWLTSVTTSAPGPSSAPTSPELYTAPSRASRVAPGARAPDAIPPTTGSPGYSAATSARSSPGSTEKGSPTTTSALGVNGTSTGSDRTAATGPKRAAQSDTPGPPSTSRPVPITVSHAAPTSTLGDSTSRTVVTTSSRAPACASVVNTIARSGCAPTPSSTWPHTSPVAYAGTGCSERAAANGITRRRAGWVASHGGQQRERDDDRLAARRAAMRLDRPVLLVGQLAAHQLAPELARFDLQRLHVARHLLAGLVGEHDFEHVGARLVRRAADDDDEVGRDRHRRRRGRSDGEHDATEVEARRRPGHGALVDLLDEEGSEDLHLNPTLPVRLGTTHRAQRRRRVRLARAGRGPCARSTRPAGPSPRRARWRAAPRRVRRRPRPRRG